MRHPSTIGLSLLAASALTVGCVDGAGHSTLPPAEVFAMPSNFEGEWIGEVGESTGMLSIRELGAGRYRGLYQAEDQPIEYVLAMEQKMSPSSAAESSPSNLVSFTWQDGRGGRGQGWLLINREDSGLTGAFGRGDAYVGQGEWTFIRLE